jgi:hypothetical protein
LPTGVASTANRNISLVGYQIGTSPNSSNSTLPCLLRAGMPIQWTTTGFMGLNVLGLPVKFGDPAVSPSPAFPAALLPNAANTPSDFDVVAPGVIGMVVGFQLYPDNQTVNLENGSAVLNAKAQGQWEYSPPIRQITSTTGIPQSAGGYYLDMSRVSSIMIGLVVVDRATLKMLNATQVQKIVNPNNWSQGQFIVPNENQTPLQAWNNTLNTLATNPNLLGPGGVPLPALQSMRIYECVFPVTPEASVFGE